MRILTARERVAVWHVADDYSYRGGHTAPSPSRGNRPLHDMDPRYYEDLPYYVNRGHADDVETQDAMTRHRGNPEGQVRVYRTLPPEHNGQINTGDWVSTSYDYAKEHSRNRGGWPVYSIKTRASDLYNDDNSLQEWGYHGPAAAGQLLKRRPRP